MYMKEEIWKDIDGYKGYYQVSNLGRVRSLDRYIEYIYNDMVVTRKQRGRIRQPAINHQGYLQLSLLKNGVSTTFKVHRLVAKAFLPNPDNLTEINHINENKQDNHINNLEWCSRQYNCIYGTAPKRRALACSKAIEQIDMDTNEVVAVFASASEASRKLGFTRVGIQRCCVKRQISCQGYYWRFLGDTTSPKKHMQGGKAIDMLDKNTLKTLASFNSMSEAMRCTGVDVATISRCCHGTQKTAGGYVWKFSKGMMNKC